MQIYNQQRAITAWSHATGRPMKILGCNSRRQQRSERLARQGPSCPQLALRVTCANISHIPDVSVREPITSLFFDPLGPQGMFFFQERVKKRRRAAQRGERRKKNAQFACLEPSLVFKSSFSCEMMRSNQKLCSEMCNLLFQKSPTKRLISLDSLENPL